MSNDVSAENETQTYLHPGRDYIIFRERSALRLVVVSVIDRNKDNWWLVVRFIERDVLKETSCKK